jgi:hypothetical protein
MEAAPSTPTTTTTTSPRNEDDDDDDDDDAAATAEPETAEEHPADDDDIFLPPLPEDNAAEPEEVDERPISRKDPGADLPGFEPAPVDQLLDDVYGDWPHHNDGRHLNGGVLEDAAWQRRWRRITALASTHYSVPKGKEGRRFIDALASEFRGVRARRWNSERPLVFVAVILQTTPGVKKARDIRKRIKNRIDLWYKGAFTALVDDTETELQNRHGSHPAADEETKARAYNAKVLSGRIRSAVRTLTSRDQGGVLQPDDKCTKTGRPVLDVLRSKHPLMRDPAPDLTDRDRGSFEPYSSLPEAVAIEITGDVVEKVALKLSGAAGPGGTDAVDLRNWLLRFGAESEHLRDALASITEWLANDSPPWAAYRGLMACRLIALDKSPGVRPVGIGEVYRRLMAKCLLEVVGHQATAAAGNLNLCAGLPAGIEGAIHAVRQSMAAPPIQPTPTGLDLDEGPLTQPSGNSTGSLADEQMDMPPDPDPIGALLVDARNGFNELGRRAMLWTVRHIWAAGARFAFNCYRHSAQLILRKHGSPGYTILSSEGVTQGDPLSMVLYGLALLPLAARLRREQPDTVQAFYADDVLAKGRVSRLAETMTLLLRLGPERGYFPEPEKSILICAPNDRLAATARLDDFDFKYADGYRYVGGFLGSDAARSEWLEPQIQQWVLGVAALAKVAKRHPQTAYAGLTKSLQQEWQYLQRVVPDCGAAFEPVEEAIRTVFLPALLQATEAECQRELTTLSVRQAGLGLPNPTQSAQASFAASEACSELLVHSLREGMGLDANLHARHAGSARRRARGLREAADERVFDRLSAAAPVMTERRLHRAKETGTWLTAMPSHLNGTVLSADEFRDSLRLRFGLVPLNLPNSCDGCGSKFTVGHAMSCKKGGLVLLRHNDVAAEWHHLCAKALTPSAVSDEPLIHTGRDGNDREHAPGAEAPPELRGDVAAHGFWRRGATAIFDIRITDTDAQSNRSKPPKKVLAIQEKEKKDKYVEPCLARRRQFTPLVFSVDGLRGAEADAATKKLASLLAAKWKRTYSEVCGFVRSRLAITLVRTTSLCLRSARDPTPRASHAVWDSGAGLALYE